MITALFNIPPPPPSHMLQRLSHFVNEQMIQKITNKNISKPNYLYLYFNYIAPISKAIISMAKYITLNVVLFYLKGNP